MRHPFLNDDACIYRLVDEFKKYGTIWVAYDFDNCVYDYHSKGHDYSEVIQLLRDARAVGIKLIVWTAEENLPKVEAFLLDNNIPWDVMNDNPPFYKSGARKIYHNLLLDDRAGLLSAYNQLKSVINIIKNQI